MTALDIEIKSNFKKHERNLVRQMAKLQDSITGVNMLIADNVVRDIKMNKLALADDSLGRSYSDLKKPYKGTIEEDDKVYQRRLKQFEKRNDYKRKREYKARPKQRRDKVRKVFVKSRLVDRSGGLSQTFKTFLRPESKTTSQGVFKHTKKSKDLTVTATTNKHTNEQTIKFSFVGDTAKILGIMDASQRGKKMTKTAPELPYKPKNRPIVTNTLRKHMKRYDKMQAKPVTLFVAKLRQQNYKLEKL